MHVLCKTSAVLLPLCRYYASIPQCLRLLIKIAFSSDLMMMLFGLMQHDVFMQALFFFCCWCFEQESWQWNLKSFPNYYWGQYWQLTGMQTDLGTASVFCQPALQVSRPWISAHLPFGSILAAILEIYQNCEIKYNSQGTQLQAMCTILFCLQ